MGYYSCQDLSASGWEAWTRYPDCPVSSFISLEKTELDATNDHVTAAAVQPDIKPSRLRWLEPGRVTSRRQTRKGSRFGTIKNEKNNMTAKHTDERNAKTHNLTVPPSMVRTEFGDLVQAVQYFNTCIYQDLLPIQELGPNPHIYTISPAQIQMGAFMPDHLRLSIICITLSHRINRTRNDDPGSYALVETFFQYRGILIRSLRDDIGVEYKRTSDIVIAGIMTLLLADTQQGASQNWRCHIDGLRKLIILRGGIRITSKSKSLEPLLLCFVLVTVIGNTTSPASDLCMAESHLEELDFILEKYGGGLFSFQMCPPQLFGEIVKINYLRMRAAAAAAAAAAESTNAEPCAASKSTKDLSQEVHEILNRIRCFSSAQWASSKPSAKEDWVLLGKIYQVAVAIYCISSLQSLLVLPPTSSFLRTCRCTYAHTLQTLIDEALLSPRIKRAVLWPLVMLGMEAANTVPEMRSFVAKTLPEMSRSMGTCVPLTAKGVLERFWASGGARWDACFERPYTFVTQIAVDISRILPLGEM
ncbi:C6 zinc finger domain-containing protein [Zalerion maritima]|uniref:C6 zinc finger domain-containing protein n=1 Tax=Zalerion maritima TaxID=339359 RepID=A0AAD5RGG1_9PEZI|nr:C6 zinc finger domain-containing protein [Zalerion maritima]